MFRTPFTGPRDHFRGSLAVLVSVLVVFTGLLPFTVATTSAAAASTTMFRGVSTPWRLSSDRAAIELGTVFTPTVSGKVTSIRFYKAFGAKGKHTGTLWTKAGKKLASVTFKKESRSGWQTAKLAKAVKLSAGKSYVVSYHVKKNGRYAVSTSVAAASATSASSTALRVSKGVYRHKSKVAFPKTKSRWGQFPVDVVYVPTAPASPGTSTPPPDAVTAPPAPASSGAVVFPTRSSVGLPSGWTPKQVVSGDMTISTPGAVVEDLQITDGTIYVKANNVTLRRVQGRGAFVKTDPGSSCSSGLVIEDSTFVKNGTTTDGGTPVIGDGGFTVRRSVIDGLPEGIRAGGLDVGCGPVSVESSYLHIVSPDVCKDWHGDGLQGYGGDKVTVRQSTFVLDERNGCYGTAPFFYPSGQGNTSVDIDGLLVSGGGYAFRNGMPGTVKNLNVVDGDWGYGPVDVKCSVVTAWQAQTVKLASNGTVTPVRSVACTGSGK